MLRIRIVLSVLSCWAALSLPVSGQLPLYTFVGGEPTSPTFELGFAVDAAGDVDADGFGDVILGSFSTGPVRVYSGRTGDVLFLLWPSPGDIYFGLVVAGVGDVDGDGFDDVAVAAPTGDAGRVRVFSGATGRPLVTFEGDVVNDSLGGSLAALGDVQGDGHSDLIAGTKFGNYARAYDGASLTPLFTVVGDAPADGFGRSVGAAGDFDGDGVLDAIVGAAAGSYARVVSGTDGRTIATFFGDGPLDGFGAAVSGGGDVDGDGRSDVIVGASAGYVRVLSGASHEILHTFARPGDAGRGRRGGTALGGTFLVGFGGTVDDAGDLDGDGFADILAGDAWEPPDGVAYAFSGQDGSLLCTFKGIPQVGPTFGNAVASAGDIDRDGRPDVVVGAPTAVNGRGYARIFACRPSPWRDLRTNHGGSPPRLEGSGLLLPRTLVSLDVFNADGTGVGSLVASTQLLGAPLFGGTLVPAPDVLIPLAPDLAGTARWEIVVPHGLPSGIEIYFHYWLPNTYEPSGWAASNALGVLTP